MSFDEIITSELWETVYDRLKHVLLFETLYRGVELDTALIEEIQTTLNRKTKNGKRDYENKACRYLKDELSNKQRKQAKIDDSTWSSWKGMVSNAMLHS